MPKPKGKETCDSVFIAAFLDARDEANRTGQPVPIKGYGGYKVHPKKDLNTDKD